MWERLQATLDPGCGLTVPLLVGPLWWKGHRPRVRPKREPKGTKRHGKQGLFGLHGAPGDWSSYPAGTNGEESMRKKTPSPSAQD